MVGRMAFAADSQQGYQISALAYVVADSVTTMQAILALMLVVAIGTAIQTNFSNPDPLLANTGTNDVEVPEQL